jgi:hypothetical protein
MKNKLRKVGSHFHRNRGKYLVALGVVSSILLYEKKEYWHNNAKELGQGFSDAEDFIDVHGLFNEYADYVNEIQP